MKRQIEIPQKHLKWLLPAIKKEMRKCHEKGRHCHWSRLSSLKQELKRPF